MPERFIGEFLAMGRYTNLYLYLYHYYTHNTHGIINLQFTHADDSLGARQRLMSDVNRCGGK